MFWWELEQAFQCSSASRKFLNLPAPARRIAVSSFSALQRAENSSILNVSGKQQPIGSFSALQRAENSSIQRGCKLHCLLHRFQCSSASRKFLNIARPRRSSSAGMVSVLFSEPKIPQFETNPTGTIYGAPVSVLFSEPKIPQFKETIHVS